MNNNKHTTNSYTDLYILSIDQGTTGTTVSIIQSDGQCVAKVNQEFRQLYPRPGWVEHDPEDIWSSVVNTIKQSLEKAQIDGNQLAAIGITNQRETSLIWDRKNHQAVSNAIVWQCRRTTAFCESLKKKGLEKKLQKKTGLVVDPYFSASKFRWILQQVPGVRRRAQAGDLAAGTVDSFLLWRLTGGEVHGTDVSNASRTQLMNIHTGNWDSELCSLFSVPLKMLPTIFPSSGLIGKTRNCPGLPDGIPISGMAGDQQAALFGQACFSPGEAKCTYGTGSFLLMNTGSQAIKSQFGLLTTAAWQLSGEKKITYALEGGAFICGAAVQWLRDGLQIIKTSSEIEELALQVPDSGGVEFIPALTGMGAPYWDPEARGLISGITRGTQRAHLARATLEAMALQNVDILNAMENDLGKKLKGLKVDGGASSNNLLMQLQANYLGVRIDRPQMIETTSAGAAFLAGLGVGYWSDLSQLKNIWQRDQEFKPQLPRTQRMKRLEHWHTAVKRMLNKS